MKNRGTLAVSESAQVVRKIWSAVTRTALCAGRGTAFSPRHARKHWLHSRSKSGVVRNTACRRTPNSFVTLAAMPPPRKKPLRLCVKKTLNSQRSTFCGRGRPRSRLHIRKTRARLAWSLVTNRLLTVHSPSCPSCPRMRNNLFFTGLSGR